MSINLTFFLNKNKTNLERLCTQFNITTYTMLEKFCNSKNIKCNIDINKFQDAFVLNIKDVKPDKKEDKNEEKKPKARRRSRKSKTKKGGNVDKASNS
jgi:hypothetical protein